MRDYLSPARKAAERIIPHPAVVRALLERRRAFVFVIVSAILVVLALGFVTVRGLMGPSTETKHTVTDDGKTSTTTVTQSNDSQPVVNQQTQTSVSASSPSSGSDTKTSVTVNGQPVDVPENGSVNKTITNDNGTTNINVSTNSDSSGNSYSSSFSSSSTSTTLNATTVTHDVSINTQ
jgi:hypothetical protein